MGRTLRYPIESIAKALRKYDGVQYYAAVELGCSPTLINNRVSEHPELQEIVEDGYAKLSGKARKVLQDSLSSDDEKIRADMAKWIEARLNKSRFSERTENVISGPDGGPVKINWTENEVV